MKHAPIYFILVLLFVSHDSFAQQSRQIEFHQYDIEDGLTNMTLMPLGQDSSGFLWFRDPVTRFDGYSFKTFSKDVSNPRAEVLRAFEMFDDGHGQVVFKAPDGIYLYDRKLENMRLVWSSLSLAVFDNYPCLPGNNSDYWCLTNQHLHHLTTRNFVEEKIEFNLPRTWAEISFLDNGLLWGLTDNAVFSYNTSTGQLKNYPTKQSKSEAERHDIILWKLDTGEILFMDDGIYKYNASTDHFEDFNLSNQIEFQRLKFKGKTIRDPDSLFYGIKDHVVFQVNARTGKVRSKELFRDTNSELPVGPTAYFKIDDGWIVVTTQDAGFFLLDPLLEDYQQFDAIAGNPNSIANSYTTHVMQTRDGTLWITGGGQGLVKAQFFQPEMEHIIPANSQNGINGGLNVRTLMEWKKNQLLVGSFNNLQLYHCDTRSFSPILNPENGSVLLKGCNRIAKDKNNNLLIGVYAGVETIYLDYENRRLVQLGNTETCADALSDIFCDSDDNFWMGNGNFVYCIPSANLRSGKYAGTTGQYRLFDLSGYLQDENNSTLYQSFEEDQRGMIWIATTAGIFIVNKATGKVELLHPATIRVGEIFKPNVQMIYLANDETLWIGTKGAGLYSYDQKKNELVQYTTNEGLPDNVIYSIAEDAEGHLWMGTNGGLCRFDPRSKKVRKYTPINGIQNYEFNGRSVCTMSDGRLAFGGIAGLNVFHPDSVLIGAITPGILFTDFKVFDKGYPYSDETIYLRHNQNTISFEFSALSFFRNQLNQYAYKLDEMDKDWVHSGTRHYASYSNLAPGRYTFHVIAANSDGVWNETGISKTIIIASPWWATWWVRLAAFVLLVGGLYAFYRYRLAQQTKLLTVRNRIASDLHDEIGSTLSSISLSSTIIQKKMEGENSEVKTLLNQIGTNTDNMMEAMSDIVWTINAKNDRFENVINRMRAFAIEMLEPKNCAVHFEADKEVESLQLEMSQRKNLYLIFKEAINNAAKYSEAKNVQVELRMNGTKNLRMKIQDDGIGFASANAPTNSMSGNGLYNMKKRAHEMKGKLLIDSSPGKGTTMELEFRLQ